MIALLIHEGKRVAIGDGGDLPTLARELGLIGATVVNRNGLVSTCESRDADAIFRSDNRRVGVPQLATFETVHADFSHAGRGKTVDVVGAGGGSLELARGDTALWSFASGAAGGGTRHGSADNTPRWRGRRPAGQVPHRPPR